MEGEIHTIEPTGRPSEMAGDGVGGGVGDGVGDGVAAAEPDFRSAGRPWSPAFVSVRASIVVAAAVTLGSATFGLVLLLGRPCVPLSLLSCALLLLLLWKNERSGVGGLVRIDADHARRATTRRRTPRRTRRLGLLEWAALFALLAANLLGSALAFS